MSDSNRDIRDINVALINAAKRGDTNEVKRLISEGADVNEVDTNYNNSLYLAVENDHLDIAKILLDNGADFITLDAAQVRHVYDKFLRIQDEHCKSSLHLAARLGNLEAVKDLLGKGAKINAQNDKGETPLHLAAVKGHKEVVEALLDKGANVDAVDEDGRTPLHWAAKNNNKEIVEALIKAKANVNIKDEDGNTPLGLATNKEIKTLFQNAEKTDPVDESSTDSEGDQEGDVQPRSDITGQNSDSTEPPIEPAETEEQPSSFFGSLFSILMKPFSLVASFFGGFFSWLFGSNEEKIDESTSQTDASVSLPKLDSLDEKKIDAQPGNHSSLAPNQSAGQTDAPQLGADDNQLLG